MKTSFFPRLFASLSFAVLSATAAHATTVYFEDFIPDSTRVGFMGFEALPATDYYSGVGPTHQEGGISIEQVHGQPDDIWTTYFHPEGDRGWYPNAGDFGYTKLWLTSGDDFQKVGFLLGTGRLIGPSFGTYELYLDGDPVMMGTFEFGGSPFYLGFSGGGFDEIRLREQSDSPGDFRSKTENALAIDAIEIANVPDHDLSTMASMFGLVSTLVAFKRRKKPAAA